MKEYNLGFVSDEEIYNHVKSTVLQYRRSINLKEFNKNIIDPIKLTFDSKIYGQTMAQTIESECIRQIDKTNNNSAKRALAIKAYDKLLHDKNTIVMIVDMQNHSGTNVPWIIRMDDNSYANERLRLVSTDKFFF